MADKRLINPVTDTIDKQRTYREQMARYKQAMRYGFYLQALMIDYAMLEDRLHSMLYYMGFIANRKDLKIYKKTKSFLVTMVGAHKIGKENGNLSIKNISGKIKLVRCVLLWTQEEDATCGDRFLIALKNQCEDIDIGAVLSTLKEIDAWCDYRNEVMHGLMNKNLDSLDAEIKERTEAGMAMARVLDNEIKKLKRGNKIRRSVNLPMN